ncbi:MAG: InlB B-repeat-containing protein, partial [Clostridia bacterium]|nr:InlB B-repeat-containing protein [Clostridia bacterium]
MAKIRLKKTLSVFLSVLMVLSCWVWVAPESHDHAHAAEAVKDMYLFAYFTGNSSDGQTIHLAVSEDGLHYTALRNNEPVIIPSKGTGAIRDPYIWYNEQDNYYYLIGTDMDSADNQWWDNCNGFLMWRSKDLVHWYDETFIDVYDMMQRFNQKVGIVHRAWAPQILWDGQSYVVYFSIDTDNVNYPADQLSIVYLKTTDLMDLDQYYEYGGILYPGFDVNDADIIQHPTNGKWYLFYKPEATTEYPTTKINMMVSDNATGPYTSADPNNSRGLDIYLTDSTNPVTEALEGPNGYFDNEGNFVMYADAYGHGSAYFYIAKTPATGDFKTWTVYGEDAHNINSLSPRHGSVVKITTEEYNRLLNNAYGITSSSFSATETLDDHLVGRYFTTTDPTYNAANGKNDLTIVNGMSMNGDYMFDQIGYYGYFQGSNYAKINLNSLVPGGLNYDDGFTITFTALVNGNADSRFFAITNGSNTTNFAVNGSSSGAYVVNDNGTQKVHTTTANLADGALHDFVISYANGNIIIYKDGELLLKKNRFNDGTMTKAWYDAISDGTLYIGALADNSGVLVGGLADFCIYDCAMSYYDVKTIQNEQDLEAGLIGSAVSGYNGFANAYPRFEHEDSGNPTSTSHYANMLYWQSLPDMPEGTGEDNNPDSGKYSYMAATAAQSQYTNVGIYYSNNTVLYVDGINTPKMPVMLGARLNKNSYDSAMITAYPSASASSTADNSNFYLMQNWYGTDTRANYPYTIGLRNYSIGHNSSTRLSADLDDANSQGNREIRYFANVLVLNTNNVTFNTYGYNKYNPSWYWEASTSGSNSSSGNASNNEGTPNHNIWVIDLRAYAAAKNQIASEYDSIVKSSSYCPATVEAYKSVVEQIMQFNPNSFNYAGGVEAAVKACSTQAQQLVNDYNVAKANLGACKTLTIPGREATCAAPGLTEGSYCEYCGEIYAEQTVTEKLPHTFGGQFTENGVDYYVQCSVCGLKLLVKQNEVRFENIFSLNKWFESDSKNPNSGTLTVDFVKDTITFTNGSTTTESVSAASGNVSRAFNCYAFPVDPATTYVLEYALTSQDATSDIFVFYYDNNGNHVGTYGGVVSGTNGASQVYNYTFTPVANAAYAELRFDSNDPGETVKFSNIGVYTQESYNTFAKENPYSRVGFNTGEAIELFTPKRIGYEFLGWYTANGTRITNTNQLDASATVYAKWREVGNSVLYNGNLFSLTEYAKTNDYNLVSSAFDGHVWVDFEEGTLNTLSPREGLGKASLAVASQLDVYNTPGTYKVPVTAGKEYVYTATHSSRAAHQTYLWFYNASGGAVNHPATGAQWINHGTNNAANGCVAQWYENTLVIRFTVPEGATHMSFRMGTTSKYAFTQTFSNIGLYAAEDYDNFVGGFIMPTQTYVPDGENVELTKAEKPGYTLAGWYENKDLSGSAFTNTASMTADKTVYAKWEIASSTLTFDLNGGSMAEATTINYKLSDTLTLPTPTREGYIFRGWKVTTAAGNWAENGICNGGDVVTGMGGNATLTAQWTIKKYTVSFDNLIDINSWNRYSSAGTVSGIQNGGFTITSNSGAGEATSSSPYFAVEPGKSYKIDIDIIGSGWDVYIFFCDEYGNWIDFKDGPTNRFCSSEDWDNVFTAPNNPAVVKAQIRLDANGSNNAVTFNNIRVYEDGAAVSDGVSYSAPQTYEYGSNYGTLPVPTKEGHTFIGWFLADGTTQVTSGEEIYTENIFVYSKWKANTHTVTWVIDGVTTTETYNYGDMPSHAIPTKAFDDTYHYTFKDWGKELTAVTGDVTYTATFSSVAHTWDNGTVTTAPSCTAEGEKTFKCTGCAATKTEKVGVTAHTPKAAVIENNVEPTCTEGGSYETVVYCSVCNAQISRKKTEVAAKGHTPGAAATCTADQKCTVCGTVLTEKLGHDYKALVTAPTCTEKGYTTHTCDRCGDSYVDSYVDATGHSYNEEVTKEPTCEDKGEKTFTCSVCGDSYKEEIAAKGHTYGNWIDEVPATCVEKGTKGHYTCSVCEKNFDAEYNVLNDLTIVINPENHTNLTKTEANAADCVNDGNIAYWTCDGCEKIYSDEDAKTEITAEETVIEKLGHSWSDTYISNGDGKENTHYQTCTRENCGEKNTAVAHTWGEGVQTTAPECTKDGVMTYTCTANGCGATYTEAITQTGHTHAAAVEENKTEATCTEDGKYDSVVYCSVCKAQISRETVVIPATGHTFGAVTSANAATCIATGNEAYKSCTVCNKFFAADADEKSTDAKDSADAFKTEIDSTNHINKKEHAQTDATCTEIGYTAGTFCEDCDKWLNGHEEIPATGHNYDKTKSEANLTRPEFKDGAWTEGYYTYTCKNDKNHTTTENVARADYSAYDKAVSDLADRLGHNDILEFATNDINAALNANNIADNLIVTEQNTVDTAAASLKAYVEKYTHIYNVTYKNDNGAVLKEIEVIYGNSFEALESATKDATAEYTYTFKAWTEQVDTETGNVTYTATYDSVANEYKLTINKVINGVITETKEYTVAYGTAYDYSGDYGPVDGYTLVVDGNLKDTMPATDVAINVNYTINVFTITWIVDGAETKETYEYGATPSFKGETTKAADAQYTYTFTGWDKEIAEVAGDATYTATYEAKANEYKVIVNTVYVDKVDSTVDATETFTYAYDTEYSVAAPLMEGYTLTTEGVLSGKMPANDVTITLTYTANSYTVTVTYTSDDGKINETKTETLTYGENYNVATPEKTGYTADKASVTGTVTGDVNEAVKYTANKYNLTIKYQYDDGTEAAATHEETVVYGTEYSVESPAITGYSSNNPVVSGTMGADDLTITVVYSKKTYTVIWHNEDGTVLETDENVPYYTMPEYNGEIPTKAATAEWTYTFDKWEPTVSVVTGDVTYTATFTATKNKYALTINYVYENGTEAKSAHTAEVEYGATYSVDSPVIEGYTANIEVVSGTMDENGSVVTVTYKVNSYVLTINYKYADGTVAKPTYTADVNYNESYSVASPAITGYTADTAVVEGTMGTDDVTVEVTYTVNSYKLTINYVYANGTEAAESHTADVNYGTDYSVVTPEIVGYTADIKVVEGTMGTDDVTVEVTYTVNNYKLTINYVYADGTVASETFEEIYTFVDTYSVDSPVIEGYTADITIVSGDFKDAKNIEVTVTYTINVYKVIFVDFDGTQIGDIQNVNYQSAATAPTTPAREGYTFTGWDKAFNSITADTTVTAQYEINQYTITFDTVGGTAIDAVTQDYGTAVTAPAAPTREGYTFAGWDVEVPATMPAENVTITAKWTVNQYTITFDTDGGTAIDAITQDYGTAVTAPAAPTKEGFTFAGWDVEVPGTMPAGDVTITAK